MTTPISEDFLTYAIPLREGANNQSLIIPDAQRNTGDDPFRVDLPAGLHTIQLLWRCEATPIHVRLHDGVENGRNIAVLPGGIDAKTVTVSFVAPPGGSQMNFVQQYAVTAEQLGTPPSTLGVTFILNPARTKGA